ncbi:hypothetical protein J6590_081217 [Homalodisca vitripennis]|nr:hypothetical protein J6590_081217 [Homalodisca vitripennis]
MTPIESLKIIVAINYKFTAITDNTHVPNIENVDKPRKAETELIKFVLVAAEHGLPSTYRSHVANVNSPPVTA